MHNFKELKIWQKSKALVKDIYLLLESFPTSEKFVLTQQIQRSAISVPSNIAEGSGKSSNKDFNRFLEIAYGSSYELETQLLIAVDLGYIDDNHPVLQQIDEVQKMIYAFSKQLKSQN